MTEINTNIAFRSSGERKRNRVVWNQVSMVSVAEW
jgi:hypothetical protein